MGKEWGDCIMTTSLKKEHEKIMKEQNLNPAGFSMSDFHTGGVDFSTDSEYLKMKENNEYELNIPDDTKIDWSGAQSDWITGKLYEAPNPNELKFSNYAEEYNFSEDVVIKELTQYIGSTYSSHYTNNNNSIQALDIWKARGTMTDSCIDTSIKYLLRYGKKEGKNRKDLLKAAHYLILAIANESS
jgi:hypothetical protein